MALFDLGAATSPQTVWASNGSTIMKEGSATVVGFLAASLVPPTVLSAIAPLSDELTIVSFAGSFLVSYPFSLAFVMVLGIPTFLLLRRFGTGWWWLILPIGFFLGSLVLMAFQSPIYLTFREVALYGSLGAASALVFWLIWRRSKNADLSVASETAKATAHEP